MGFHSDNVGDIAEETGVVIVSLGGERILRFKWKGDPAVNHDFRLASGSLLFMSRELQKTWTHGVPKQAESDQRISLVFRRIPY
jgi:alkylated DNA repair dioxygenase AlkB